jgi:hypothetical protein
LSDVQSPLVFDQIFHDYEPPTKQSKVALTALQQVGMLPLARYGLKSRRFNGLWARNLLMTNGAIKGLDSLFCLNETTRKRVDSADPQSYGTHLDLCVNFDEDSKLSLKEYISHQW